MASFATGPAEVLRLYEPCSCIFFIAAVTCPCCLQLSKEDALLDWSRTWRELHNQVRAFAGWPGTVGSFSLHDQAGSGAAGERSSWLVDGDLPFVCSLWFYQALVFMNECIG